jgi:Family of unknown function (DUF5677)
VEERQTEEEFRRVLFQKHENHFVYVYQLHQFAEEAMAKYKGVTATTYKTAMWLILARAFKSFDSIRRLCEVANCEDAGILLRSLLNLMAITRWISKDPEIRAKRYLGWYWVDMKQYADKHGALLPPEWVSQINQKYASNKRIYEYKDLSGNVRMAEKWYEPDARHIRDLCCQVDLELQYEDAYKPLSGVEHSDATAYFAMVTEMERGHDENSLAVHSDLFLPHYLRNAFQYFAEIFTIANDSIDVVDPKSLAEFRIEGTKFYASDPSYKP